MHTSRFSRKSCCGLLGTWLLLACCATPTLAQPRSLVEAFTVPLDEGLGYVLRGETSNPVATRIIFRLGESGDETYRDELHTIVERYTGRYEKRGLVVAAMHALWKLGEEDAYFRGIALRWREDEWNARMAMNVLALSPTPENLGTVEQVASEATGGLLTSALGIAQGSAEQIAQYEALHSPQEKVDYALMYTVGSWRGSSSEYKYVGVNIQKGLRPRQINGRRWLRELSEEYPDLVARAIANYSTESVVLGPRIESVRDHLAHFISEEARATLQRLRAEQ